MRLNHTGWCSSGPQADKQAQACKPSHLALLSKADEQILNARSQRDIDIASKLSSPRRTSQVTALAEVSRYTRLRMARWCTKHEAGLISAGCDGHRTAMSARNFCSDVRSKAKPLPGINVPAAKERLKKVRQNRGRDRVAGVRHRQGGSRSATVL